MNESSTHRSWRETRSVIRKRSASPPRGRQDVCVCGMSYVLGAMNLRERLQQDENTQSPPVKKNALVNRRGDTVEYEHNTINSFLPSSVRAFNGLLFHCSLPPSLFRPFPFLLFLYFWLSGRRHIPPLHGFCFSPPPAQVSA